MLLSNLKIKRKMNSTFNYYALLEIPRSVLFVLAFLISFSIVCLYSACGGKMQPFVFKQLMFLIIAIIAFLATIILNIKVIYNNTYKFFFCSIFLLVFVIPFGRKALGASRWIDLGIFNLQPSEVAKIAVVLVLAKYFSKINVKNIYRIKTSLTALIIVSPVLLLVVIQPDLATSMIIFGIFFSILFIVGIPIWHFIFSGIVFLISLPILWFYFLKEYQKHRIINFIFPENDKLGTGYNIIQSKIAVGSGGLFGKGFMQGTQGRLKFLPEYHTDFIFTIVGEEFGFIGCMILILCYAYFVYYGLKVASSVNSIYGKIVCFGCSTILFLHAFINIGMTISLLPVAGIPLIMFSYGGCGLLIGMVCIALIINVNINNSVLRYKI